MKSSNITQDIKQKLIQYSLKVDTNVIWLVQRPPMTNGRALDFERKNRWQAGEWDWQVILLRIAGLVQA